MERQGIVPTQNISILRRAVCSNSIGNPFGKRLVNQKMTTRHSGREFVNYISIENSDPPLSELQLETPKGNISNIKTTPSKLFSKGFKHQNSSEVISHVQRLHLPASDIEYGLQSSNLVFEKHSTLPSDDHNKFIELFRKTKVFQNMPNIFEEAKVLTMINISPKSMLDDAYLMPSKKTNRKTLVLDLEQILLITSNFILKKEEICNLKTLGAKIEKTPLLGIQFILRPYAKNFLIMMSKYFEIVLLTCLNKDLTLDILSCLDPNNSLIEVRIFKKPLLRTNEKSYIKDLRILKGRNPKNIIILDTCIFPSAYNLDNLYPIKPFNGNPSDSYLANLIQKLLDLHPLNDIRIALKKEFQIQKLVNSFQIKYISEH